MNPISIPTAEELLRENEELHRRLEEAEETIRALRAGEVDAVFVGVGREQVYTLEPHDNSYRLMVAQVPHAAAALTADGLIISCNRRFSDLLLQPPAALRGRPLRDFVAPGSHPALDSLLRDGRTIEVRDSVTLLRGDGTTVSIWLGVSAQREGALGLCLVATDLSEQRLNEELTRAREALLQSEALLAAELADVKLLQEISTRLIREEDVDSLYRQILDAAADLLHSDFASMQALDLDRGELRLLDWRGFHPESAKYWEVVGVNTASTCGLALQLGERVIVPDVESPEYTVDSENLAEFRRSGIRSVQSTPLLSRSGTMLGMISTHWRIPHVPSDRDLRLLDVVARLAADLIERKKAEEALLQKQRQLQLVSDSVPALISYVDAEFRYRFCNRAYSQWFGLSREDVIGRTMKDVLGEEAWATIGPHAEAALAGSTADFVAEARYARGGTRWIHAIYTPDRGADGRVRGVVIMVSDVTLNKATEQALRDADRKKDEFLATLAHELRNPLAPIRNAVQILKAKGPPTPELQWARAVIERQVQHMARLLEDLMDVSRISRNKLELRTERVDLAAVVESAVETSRPLIEAGRHEFTVNLPPGAIYLDADPVRLAQVFSNLLNNAARYTEEGGRIRLTVGRQGSEAVVSVKDTGIGIPAEVVPHVFEVYSQANPTLSRSQCGLGIGLSLVRGLVVLHGGRVEARSDGPGRGSEFIVRLPIAASAPAPEPAPAESGVEDDGRPATARRRVLIVDDNRDSADSMAMILTIMGHEVGTAYDGRQALEVAANLKPDVVLLDIEMPKLNGYDTCRILREQSWGKGMTLIALTGWGQEEDRRNAEAAGFDHHMIKPVDPTELLKILATHFPS